MDILGKVSCFIMNMYIVFPHKNRLTEVILMSTRNLLLFLEAWKDIPK